MRRSVLALALAGLSAGTAAGDALILRSGNKKVVGHVIERQDFYEVTVDGQPLVFAKDDVLQWIRSPKEIIGEADKLVERAKAMYLEAVEIQDDKRAEEKFREALPLVVEARTAYGEARDVFPDGYAELDLQLVNVMKLMRLIRERIGSQLAAVPPMKIQAAPAPPPLPIPAPATLRRVSLDGPLAVMLDPVRRGLDAERQEAREAFRAALDQGGPLVEVAVAGFLFLSRDDKEWNLVADVVSVQGSGIAGTYHGKLVKKTATSSVLSMPGRGEVRLRFAEDGTFVTPPEGAEFRAFDMQVQNDVKSDAFEALQKCFSGLGVDRIAALSEKEVAEAVNFLALKTKELKLKDAEAPVGALRLFVCALASALIERDPKAAPSLDPAFKDVGFEKSEYGAVWGDRPGLAMDDFKKWVASGEYGLAVVQFKKDYSALREFGVRYAHGLLMLLKALAENRHYHQAAVQFELSARAAEKVSLREHLQALAKSIRDAAPCRACAGTHQVNCSACKGKAKVTLQCNRCGGSGKLNTFKGVATCPPCKGEGLFRNKDCPKCKGTPGKTACKARGCTRAVPAPTFESFAEVSECGLCKGRGNVLRHVAYPCWECMGMGMILRPRSDASKTIR